MKAGQEVELKDIQAEEPGDMEKRLVKTSNRAFFVIFCVTHLSNRADVFLPFIPTQLTFSLRGSNTLYEEKVK